MKLIILCLILSVLTWLGSCSPIDPKRQLINRPTMRSLYRRSPERRGVKEQPYGVKELTHSIKEYDPTPYPHLTKGQYMCGNRVCRLSPGEIPKGCNNGMCQYPV